VRRQEQNISSTFSLITSETGYNSSQSDHNKARSILGVRIQSDHPNRPAAWVPSTALRQFYKAAVQKANQPSKDEIEQSERCKISKKAARQKEASTGDLIIGRKKRGSQAPKGLEDQSGRGQEKTRQHRFRLLAQDDMKRIKS